MPNPEDFPRIDRLMAGWEPSWPMVVSTIAEYIFCNLSIQATCRGCGRYVEIDLVAIGEKYGRDTKVDAVCRALRCRNDDCDERAPPVVLVIRDGDNRLRWRSKKGGV